MTVNAPEKTTRAVLDLPVLEGILQAAKKPKPTKDRDGFYFLGDDVKLSCSRNYWDERDYVTLFFQKIEPQMEFTASFRSRTKFPHPLKLMCNYVRVKTDPLFHASPNPDGSYCPDDEWLAAGTVLLNQAAQKYELPKLYIDEMPPMNRAPPR